MLSKEENIDIIQDIIKRSEIFILKFTSDKPQYTLLKNRINALKIGENLIKGRADYKREELENALVKIQSLKNKSEKAIFKLNQLNPNFARLDKIISCMKEVEILILESIEKLGK